MKNYEDWAEENLEEVVCVDCGCDSLLFYFFEQDLARCEDCWIEYYQAVIVTED